MIDLIEEKTLPENCANRLEKVLKEGKTPSELFLPTEMSAASSRPSQDFTPQVYLQETHKKNLFSFFSENGSWQLCQLSG